MYLGYCVMVFSQRFAIRIGWVNPICRVAEHNARVWWSLMKLYWCQKGVLCWAVWVVDVVDHRIPQRSRGWSLRGSKGHWKYPAIPAGWNRPQRLLSWLFFSPCVLQLFFGSWLQVQLQPQRLEKAMRRIGHFAALKGRFAPLVFWGVGSNPEPTIEVEALEPTNF